jgi:hypothetical protein
MKMNGKENGWGKGVVAAWWVESIVRMVCAKAASLGGPTAAARHCLAGRHGRRRLAQQHSTNTHTRAAQPRCSRWAGCLRRIALQTSATCRFAMPVPSPVASHHDPSRSLVT